MPTVNLNKEVFEKLVGKKLEIEELKDRISMLGTDLENIEGNEIKVEVFPNRPDMLSEQGFARAFSSFIGVKTGLRKYEIKKSGYEVVVDPSVTMRPYTVCAIVKNIDFTDEKIKEIMQIQEKLALTHGRNRKKSAYGLYPVKNINFPITYIAKDPSKVSFHPLGMGSSINASEVEKLHPKGKEYKHLAEGWKKYPFFIDAKDNVMCMLPYTNSHDTGKVELDTKEVFIECTGTDLDNVQQALNILVTMLADMGGEIYSIDIRYHDRTITTPDLSPKKVKFNLQYINKMLGLNLSENEAEQLLSKMGFGYENGNVLVPSYRADIMHQVDFGEDIAIAYGFENFVPEILNVMTIGGEDPFETFKNNVANILVGLGLLETYTNRVTGKVKQTSLMNFETELVELANSVSSENDCVRSWLTPCLMEVLHNNRHHELPHKLFDIGEVFNFDKENKTETGVKEDTRLGIVVAQEDADYTKVRQILDYLFSHLGIKASYKETEHSSFIPGRVARVSVSHGEENKQIAYIGEIHPSVLSNWGLEVPVAVFELNLSELFGFMDLGK